MSPPNVAPPQGSAEQKKNVLTKYNFTRSVTKQRALPVAQAPFLTPLHLQIKVSEAQKQDFSQQQLRTDAGEHQHLWPVSPASTRRAGPGGTQPCADRCLCSPAGMQEEENDQASVDEGRGRAKTGTDRGQQSTQQGL